MQTGAMKEPNTWLTCTAEKSTNSCLGNDNTHFRKCSTQLVKSLLIATLYN